MTIDKHTLALISIVGSSLRRARRVIPRLRSAGRRTRTAADSDARGHLRTCSSELGYGLALGPVFGLASGVAHGITLAWEFSRASRHGPKPGFWYDTAMSAIRGAGFALGAAYLYGGTFGATFGALSTVGQVIAYRAGIRPTIDYQPATRPRLTKLQFLAAVNRTVGYGAAGYVSALMAHQRANALSVGVKAGLVIGVVTAIGERLHAPSSNGWPIMCPEKRMGVFGVGLILIGFALQSVQYWLALLGVTVR